MRISEHSKFLLYRELRNKLTRKALPKCFPAQHCTHLQPRTTSAYNWPGIPTSASERETGKLWCSHAWCGGKPRNYSVLTTFVLRDAWKEFTLYITISPGPTYSNYMYQTPRELLPLVVFRRVSAISRWSIVATGLWPAWRPAAGIATTCLLTIPLPTAHHHGLQHRQLLYITIPDELLMNLWSLTTLP